MSTALLSKKSWLGNFNEGLTLQASVEAYYQRFGFYMEPILADQIYRNRENLRYCKAHGIRLSGPQLGRPSADQQEKKRFAKKDASE